MGNPYEHDPNGKEPQWDPPFESERFDGNHRRVFQQQLDFVVSRLDSIGDVSISHDDIGLRIKNTERSRRMSVSWVGSGPLAGVLKFESIPNTPKYVVDLLQLDQGGVQIEISIESLFGIDDRVRTPIIPSIDTFKTINRPSEFHTSSGVALGLGTFLYDPPTALVLAAHELAHYHHGITDEIDAWNKTQEYLNHAKEVHQVNLERLQRKYSFGIDDLRNMGLASHGYQLPSGSPDRLFLAQEHQTLVKASRQAFQEFLGP